MSLFMYFKVCFKASCVIRWDINYKFIIEKISILSIYYVLDAASLTPHNSTKNSPHFIKALNWGLDSPWDYQVYPDCKW